MAPTQGTVRFDGEYVGGVASERICRRGIGFVPEDRRIFPGLTVEENLVLGFMQVPGRGRAEDRRQLDASERRRQTGTTRSGGEQQMLAIARVLVGKQRLLLIDEPTEGLEPKIVDENFALMEGLRRDGIPILLVEQNMHRAVALVQRFYVLEHGAVVMAGDGAKAADREALVRQLAA